MSLVGLTGCLERDATGSHENENEGEVDVDKDSVSDLVGIRRPASVMLESGRCSRPIRIHNQGEAPHTLELSIHDENGGVVFHDRYYLGSKETVERYIPMEMTRSRLVGPLNCP